MKINNLPLTGSRDLNQQERILIVDSNYCTIPLVYKRRYSPIGNQSALIYIIYTCNMLIFSLLRKTVIGQLATWSPEGEH